jgi:DNA-binding transcriptional MerR regulator
VKIGQLARTAGVTVDTVRFYERRGVLRQPERLPSGYRVYTAATVERIRLAKQLQALGLTLDEVIDALHAADAGTATCASERWRLERVIERIDAQIGQLQTVRGSVLDVLAQCDSGRCRFADDRDTSETRGRSPRSEPQTASETAGGDDPGA